MRYLRTSAILLLAALAFAPRTAEAYLDANTGSIIVQLLVGGVAGLALAGRLFWHRIARALGLKKEGHDDG